MKSSLGRTSSEMITQLYKEYSQVVGGIHVDTNTCRSSFLYKFLQRIIKVTLLERIGDQTFILHFLYSRYFL